MGESNGISVNAKLGLSGVALLAALLLLFLPVLGSFFILAGIYSGNTFPTKASPILEVPTIGNIFRGLLISIGLAVLGVGVWLQVNSRVLDLFHRDQKVRVGRINSDGIAVVHAENLREFHSQSFSLRQHRALLLRDATFSGQVAFIISDIHIFASNKVMLVQKLERYPALLQASKADTLVEILATGDRKVKIGDTTIAIAQEDVLLDKKVSAHDEMPFCFAARPYLLRIVSTDVAIFGPGYISVAIEEGGQAPCR